MYAIIILNLIWTSNFFCVLQNKCSKKNIFEIILSTIGGNENNYCNQSIATTYQREKNLLKTIPAMPFHYIANQVDLNSLSCRINQRVWTERQWKNQAESWWLTSEGFFSLEKKKYKEMKTRAFTNHRLNWAAPY